MRISSAPAAAAFTSADVFAKKKQRKQEMEKDAQELDDEDIGKKKKKLGSTEKKDDEEEPLIMLEAKGGAKSFVNREHFDKLCALYARFGPTTTSSGRTLTTFEQKQRRDASILSMLQRLVIKPRKIFCT